MIYLASGSPRRRTLLRKMRIAFRVVPTRYVEKHLELRSPSRVAMRHALGKARHAVVSKRDGLVLGVDTLIYFNKQMIGKPKTHRDAIRMLESFSGKSHDVYSAIALIDLKNGRRWMGWDKTRVTFHPFDTRTIREYLSRVNPLDKAGGYAIQDRQELIRTIRGSFTNVMGLPVELLRRQLRRFGKARTGRDG